VLHTARTRQPRCRDSTAGGGWPLDVGSAIISLQLLPVLQPRGSSAVACRGRDALQMGCSVHSYSGQRVAFFTGTGNR
jgi:hypothetical protein